MGVNVLFQLSDLMRLSERDLSGLLCSASMMREYLVFPENFNVQDLVDITCGINTTVLMAEFEQQFGLNKLIEQVSKTSL